MKSMMMRFLGSCAAVLLAIPVGLAEKMYDEESYAGAKGYSIGESKSITLDEDGYAVLKVSGIKPGTEYTFQTVTAGSDGSTTIDVTYFYDADGDTWDSTLATSDTDVHNGQSERAFIELETWYDEYILIADPEDAEFQVKPKAYYVQLNGTSGASLTLGSSVGIVPESIPKGSVDNKDSFGDFTKNATIEKKNVTFIADEDSYWYTVTLNAGKKYRFVFKGADDADVTAAGDEMDVPAFHREIGDDGSIVIDIMPYSSGKYFIEVDGEGGTKFSVTGSVYPGRLPADHPISAVLDDGVAVPAVAGARNDSDGKFYDEVADTSLFKVELRAGRIALFETAFTNDALPRIALELYDAEGTCLGRNFYKGPTEEGLGQRLSFVPKTSGTYYVGVLQPELDLDETPDAPTYEGLLAYADAGDYVDDGDDLPTHAATLSVVLGTAETEGALQLYPDGTSRGFTATNVVDWFVLGGRGGIEYQLSAVSSKYMSLRPMNISVYAYDARGNLNLVEDGNLGDPEAGVAFTPPADGTYYLKLSIPDGAGCDYPYEFRAWVDGSEYGFLRVDIKGASEKGVTLAKWQIAGESTKWDTGAEILCKTGTVKVTGTKVNGWTRKADITTVVKPGNEDRQHVFLKYDDGNDPKDDVIGGAVKIAPSKAKPATLDRSLWAADPSTGAKADPVDFLKLDVKAGTAYDFGLIALEGSPVVTVYRGGKVSDANVVARGMDFRMLAQESASYYVTVTRTPETEDVDAAYSLTVKACNVGSVKTDKADYTVGEKAGALSVKFTRTSGEGRVRIRYTTVEGTAKANENYVAQTGILEWADGKKDAKTVKIKIIPDLIDAWDEAKQFSIRIDAVDDGDYDPTAEYRPIVENPVVGVTITDSTKKAGTGTLQPTGSGLSIEPFANAKKPAFSVNAGENARLWISRDGGADLSVGVKVTVTAKQSAGQEFVVTDEQQVWWNDGDAETKFVDIPTMRPAEGYFAPKSFTVKLAALAGDGKPSVKNGSVAVTVTDGEVSRTAADYTSSFDKASGITAKTSGDWYFDAAGQFRCATPAAKKKSTFTYTFAGPGRLFFVPHVVNGDDASSCVCTLNKETVDLDGEPYERYLESGKYTLTFTVNRAAAPAADSETYLAFEAQDDGDPIRWEPLRQPSVLSPAFGVKQLQKPGCVHLRWTSDSNPRIAYLLHLDEDKRKIGTTSAKYTSLRDDQASRDLGLYPCRYANDFCEGCSIGCSFEPNRTYYWRVDSVMLDDEGKIRLVNANAKTVWSFKTAAVDSPCPKSAEEPSFVDASGREIAKLINNGEPVELVQGINVTNLVFVEEEGRSGVTFGLVSGAKLPTGMTLTKDGRLTGAPQKTGTYSVAIQAMNGKTAAAAIGLTLKVDPILAAAGTFAGILQSDDPQFDDIPSLANMRIGSLNVTVKESGSISASVTVGGTKYAFKKSSYDSDVTNFLAGAAGATVRIAAPVSFKFGKTTQVCTNVLQLAVSRGSLDEVAVRGGAMTAEMTLNVLSPDKKSVVEGLTWTGEAMRDNTKIAEVLAAEQPYVAYYTVTLPVVDASTSGAPQGNGYLTLTLDAKGKVKVAGTLANGSTTFSASSVVGCVEDAGSGESEMRIPVFFAKGAVSCGGWVVLRLGENVTIDGEQDIGGGKPIPVVDSGRSRLLMFDSSAHAAYSWGEWSGYWVEIQPVGGYYSKLVNLQAYYKRYAVYLTSFESSGMLPDDVIQALYGDSYEIVAYPGKIFNEESGEESGLYLDLSVNAVSVDKTSLVYVKDAKGKATKVIDWNRSVNPCKFVFKFKQATGLFDGSFDLYAAKGTDEVPVKVSSCKHKGLWVMARDSGSALSANEGAFSGYYVSPVKLKDDADNKSYTWNASYQLLFGADEIVNPPAEGLPLEMK